MRAALLPAIALLAAATAAPALAQNQFARPQDAVRYRQSAWFLLEQHVLRIGAMVRGRTPWDGKRAIEDAELVATLARLPLAGFAPGTEKLSDKARPEIWTEQARFREHNDKLVQETTRLAAAARSQNLDNLKAAYAATVNACKGCHDAYRNN